jgi:hypothetical protein
LAGSEREAVTVSNNRFVVPVRVSAGTPARRCHAGVGADRRTRPSPADHALGVLERLLGLPPAENRFRRRLADPGKVEEASAAFLSLCGRKGIEPATAKAVLAELARFSDYSFCKSHAVSYAGIAWQECYLKAHAPVAFACAVLNNHEGAYPRRVHVEAAKRCGVAVYPPCVNRSQAAFTQEVAAVRTGLDAIRALGEGVPSLVLDERRRNSPFQSLADFRKRVALVPQDLAVLVRAGCLDFTGRSPAAILREAEASQYGRLPSSWDRRADYEPWPLDGLPARYTPATLWRDQWELLGFLPGPPLLGLVRACLPPGLSDSRLLPELAGQRGRLAGLVAAEREGERSWTLEEEWGLIDVRQVGGDRPAEELGPVVVAEGVVEERHGVPVVVEARLSRPLPAATGPRLAEGTKRSPALPDVNEREHSHEETNVGGR